MGIKENVERIVERYREIETQLMDPDNIMDVGRLKKLNEEMKKLAPLYGVSLEYKDVTEEIAANEELINDPELGELAREEIKNLQVRRAELERKLRELLIPQDPMDDKNIILEIRSGTGGEEAALFAADLLRMYIRYAEKRRFKVEILSQSLSDAGGVKEAILSIKGKGAYSIFKFESGTHRVQRIPVTESQGRIHTSAATVAVLPEAEDIDVEINPDDLRIDVFRASGHGGQHVNTTDSAVRITHLPTGIVVSCQDEKSQYKNKDKAMRILRSRLCEYHRKQRDQEIAHERRKQVGSGDRSERIRTYNFPQGRVTDHRINLTLYNLEEILDGELFSITGALAEHERMKKLESIESE